MDYKTGQRWASETEPELGLGRIEESEARFIRVFFPACNETRRYARESAPLKRIVFSTGETLESIHGFSITIQAVREKNGLLFYEGEKAVVAEPEIRADIRVKGLEVRLLEFDFDEPALCAMRRSVLSLARRLTDSKSAGFTGGRMDLIPHQLFIAEEVSRRMFPRVLLADEVGLGKTIEAALILHRLLRTHRIARVLILVPDSLVHQWLVELMRRFNLWFQIADREFCEAAGNDAPEGNPFLSRQLILCGISTLTSNPAAALQAAGAGWDMVVIDEAHHLVWSPQASSPAYETALSLSLASKGMILLTATPEQLGPLGHFARLRLLDPARYHDCDEYLARAESFRDIAALGNQLAAGGDLSAEDKKRLFSLLQISAQKAEKALHENREAFYAQALRDLLDRHGLGRVMFRNTRAVMKNFPARKALIENIETDFEHLRQVTEEQAAELQNRQPSGGYSLIRDPRILWLDGLLARYRREKFLLICRSLAKAKAVEAALKERRNIKTAVFHEELSLIQRDRQAAWFADPEGARILICSEIGSEGRNFQFAHHLILFDMPQDPEMLEQRIGRLDRIGQKKHIYIHVPTIAGTPSDVWVRWYHEALNAFEENCPAATACLQVFGLQLEELAMHPASPAASDKVIFEKRMKRLIQDTQKLKQEVQEKLKQGRDRLLELGSFDPQKAAAIIEEIHECDGDFALEEMMEMIFDQLGVVVEETDARTYFIRPGEDFAADAFPALPKEGVVITYDRMKAIQHENFQFMTWDHPMTAGAVEMVMGSNRGSCALAVLPAERHGFVLEAAYVMESLAPLHLNITQYLPGEPVRVRVNLQGSLSENEAAPVYLGRAEIKRFAQHLSRSREVCAELLRYADTQSQKRLSGLIKNCLTEVDEIHKPEIERLHYLKSVNDAVTEDEVRAAEETWRSLRGYIKKARLRLDSVCLMLETPEDFG